MKKRILAAGLSAVMALSMGATALAADDQMDIAPNQTAPVSSGVPDDVADTAWYKAAVDYVLEYNLIDLSAAMGGKVNFEPEVAITREEVAETIFRDAKLRNVSDVENAGNALKEMADYNEISAPFLQGVSFCYYSDIMKGDEQHKINPNANITREELAAVLERYYKYLVPTSADASSGMAIEEFTDAASISKFAVEPVRFCIANDLLRGNANGSFKPKGNVTRAEMAQIAFNMEQRFVAKAYEGLKLITK